MKNPDPASQDNKVRTMKEFVERRSDSLPNIHRAKMKTRMDDHRKLVEEISSELMGRHVCITTTFLCGEKASEVWVHIPNSKPAETKLAKIQTENNPRTKDITLIWKTGESFIRIRLPFGGIIVSDDGRTFYTQYDSMRINFHILA